MRLSRFVFVVVCSFGALGIYLPAASGAEAVKSETPNVLLICVDDLKPTLGCYGDSVARTPSIDRLATRALRIEAAYCNQAVCSPSRNALMTGLRPQTIGVYDLATNFRVGRPDAVTMGEFFQRHGYQTASLGKIFHVGHGNGDDAQSWSVPSFRPRGSQYAIEENEFVADNSKEPSQKKNAGKGNANKEKGRAIESAEVDDDFYKDGQIAAEAVRRLKQASESRTPFFLAVGFLKPHLPFVAPKRYWDLYDPSKLPMPELTTPPAGAPSYAPQFGGELRNYRDIPAGDQKLSDELTRELIHGYYAATSYMDAQVGRVLTALEELKLDSNTIVILWGDHGWHLGDHGMWCKHTNYEQATRIPLLVAVPGGKGSVTKALVETVDIYPTLAALAGLPSPEKIDGVSFSKLLEDPSVSHRDHVIHVYPRGKRLGRAIRTDRYRFVAWEELDSDGITAEVELYDYLNDPLETINVAEKSPELVEKYLQILQSHPQPVSPKR